MQGDKFFIFMINQQISKKRMEINTGWNWCINITASKTWSMTCIKNIIYKKNILINNRLYDYEQYSSNKNIEFKSHKKELAKCFVKIWFYFAIIIVYSNDYPQHNWKLNYFVVWMRNNPNNAVDFKSTSPKSFTTAVEYKSWTTWHRIAFKTGGLEVIQTIRPIAQIGNTEAI